MTKDELSNIKSKGFNTNGLEINPCSFLNKEEKCSIHDIRPIDCQFFPFDVHKTNGKLFWVIWKIPCLIADKTNKEEYLNFFEKNIIPNFKQHLEDYCSFHCEGLMNNYAFEILREVKNTK